MRPFIFSKKGFIRGVFMDKKKTIAIVLAVLILVVAGAGFGISKILFGVAGDSDKEVEITIPSGVGSSAIADILSEKGIIKSNTGFKLYARLHNGEDFKAGTYSFRENMTLKEISDILKSGISNGVPIAYIEGEHMRWLAAEIAKVTDNTEEDVFALLSDEAYLDSLIEKYWFISEDIKNPDIYYALEGYLFPETYMLPGKDASVEKIFDIMLSHMDTVLSEYRDEIEKSKYSVHEILTMASVIEKESLNEEQRKGVSGVIYNRLEKGMSIGSDVTTYYAVKADMAERDLYQSEIESANPYNTRGPGMEGKLPVGPISSVSRSSIEAALEPDTTDNLYFVADKNGEVYFAKDLDGHHKIIAELQEKGLWYEY